MTSATIRTTGAESTAWHAIAVDDDLRLTDAKNLRTEEAALTRDEEERRPMGTADKPMKRKDKAQEKVTKERELAIRKAIGDAESKIDQPELQALLKKYGVDRK